MLRNRRARESDKEPQRTRKEAWSFASEELRHQSRLEKTRRPGSQLHDGQAISRIPPISRPRQPQNERSRMGECSGHTALEPFTGGTQTILGLSVATDS